MIVGGIPLAAGGSRFKKRLAHESLLHAQWYQSANSPLAKENEKRLSTV